MRARLLPLALLIASCGGASQPAATGDGAAAGAASLSVYAEGLCPKLKVYDL
ncbi:MAG: hypothetical protein JRI23_09980, partial [Deltaproteobacteria bacterium]|nr:hypothetical protein [Deltaproteobacteria bacterium]MBW2532000.1 hypothetical protein [Deltaproteobacteria bacterium]